MTPSGIKPATFRLVAQCLNQLRHRVPIPMISNIIYNLQSASPLHHREHYITNLILGLIAKFSHWGMENENRMMKFIIYIEILAD
jgi:hypothetical protein